MRRLPSLFALRAFEAAARLESFAAAADELAKTPSAISHQVRALEAWFGQPLFRRQIRRVTLTPEGGRLLDKLTRAFDLIEEACGDLRPPDQRSALAVHCSPSFASKWLSPRLPRFMTAYPGITIGLSSSAEPVDLEHDETVDVDITYGDLPARSGVIIESLGLETILPMCAPALIEGHDIRRPEDVTAFTLIDSKLSPAKWPDWCLLNGVKLPGRARPSFDRGALAIAAAVDGIGVALETARFAESELARGQLVALDLPGFKPIERVLHSFCYRKADRGHRNVTAFRNWIREQMG